MIRTIATYTLEVFIEIFSWGTYRTLLIGARLTICCGTRITNPCRGISYKIVRTSYVTVIDRNTSTISLPFLEQIRFTCNASKSVRVCISTPHTGKTVCFTSDTLITIIIFIWRAFSWKNASSNSWELVVKESKRNLITKIACQRSCSMAILTISHAVCTVYIVSWFIEIIKISTDLTNAIFKPLSWITAWGTVLVIFMYRTCCAITMTRFTNRPICDLNIALTDRNLICIAS